MNETDRIEINRIETEIIGTLYFPIFDFIGNETGRIGNGSIPVETKLTGYDTNGIVRFIIRPERN